jgi:hypothetical protein
VLLSAAQGLAQAAHSIKVLGLIIVIIIILLLLLLLRRRLLLLMLPVVIAGAQLWLRQLLRRRRRLLCARVARCRGGTADTRGAVGPRARTVVPKQP